MKHVNQKKIQQLKINKNNTYVVIDFDRTITSNESQDSWAASANPKAVGKELGKQMDELYEKYAPIEIDYTITKEEKEKAMEKWYAECMDLYYTHHLTKQKLKKSIKQSKLIFRKGAKSFLEKTYEQNIPVIILSAGIGNVIEQFLNQNNSYYSNMYIISNFMTFDSKGNIEKFDNSKMIHSLNKTMKKHLPIEIQEMLKQKQYKILIGDLIEDEKMVEKEEWDTTIKIGILNKKIEENIEEYKKHFDIVLTEEDANFELIEEILSKEVK